MNILNKQLKFLIDIKLYENDEKTDQYFRENIKKYIYFIIL